VILLLWAFFTPNKTIKEFVFANAGGLIIHGFTHFYQFWDDEWHMNMVATKKTCFFLFVM
jgi:hypothetical protein